MRTRIKICGLTREQDVLAAVHAGADAIGLVFFAGSKRAVSIEQARELRRHIPAFVSVVALLVNAEPDTVDAVVKQVQPDLLQFHGDETPVACESFGHRFIRAFRIGGPGMDTPEQVVHATHDYGGAAGWLFDTYSDGYGGSGQSFDYSLLKGVDTSENVRPLILAGGLNPDTVGGVVQKLRPFAVDVSSGVETAPGVKSSDRIRAFVQAVRQADGTLEG